MADKIIWSYFWNFLLSATKTLLFLNVILIFMVHWQIIFSVV